MNETQELLDKVTLRTVRAIILRDVELAVPRPTNRELAVLRSIACSNAVSFGTKLIARRALAWLTGQKLSEVQREFDSVAHGFRSDPTMAAD